MTSASKDKSLPINYEAVLNSILKDAGKLILSYRSQTDSASDKEKNEIVTPADIASNKLIIAKLRDYYPEIPIYSEEEDVKSQANTRWIVDPLDGTTPWVWGNSGFSISIALENE